MKKKTLDDCPHCGKKMNKIKGYNFALFECPECHTVQMIPIKLLEEKK